MLTQPPYPANRQREYSRASIAEIGAGIDRLEARIDHAENRIAEALTPGPVDWEAHYRDVLSDAAAAGRRVGALAEGGA